MGHGVLGRFWPAFDGRARGMHWGRGYDIGGILGNMGIFLRVDRCE